MKTIHGLDELGAHVGEQLGCSDWVSITQAAINQFADATRDHQWIHVDSERAAREMPGGKTIAHGFFTLSLLPLLSSQSHRITGFTTMLNYGVNKVRFMQPVTCGSQIRGVFTLQNVEYRDDGRVLMTTDTLIEIQGADKPACFAEMLVLLIP